MALPAVCFLLLLFSMLPLFDATDCDRGLYCPAGSDCNRDNALCEAGSDNCTISEENKPDCDEDILAFFSLSQFAVRENNGPVEPVIRISRALQCCSLSLMIKVEDGTTIGNIDYDFPRGGYIEAIIPGGMRTASFAIRLKDDDIIEGDEYFFVSIVKESLPHGVTWGGPERVRVYIQDDDNGCVHLGRQTAYSVRENAILQVGLELTTKATYDIDVTIGTTAFTASRCDFQNVRYTATFKAGNTRASFRIDITDDDIFEGNEGFNFEIDSDTSSAVVARCRSGFRGSVTIMDDEREISVGFDSSTYTVEEDVGVFSPELTLDRPSPCCITVLAELVNGTALGRGVDFGYSPPERYEYVFPAGETCATPDKPIPINDDRISELTERFTMTILPLSLPLGVRASRSTATINLIDIDIAVTFEKDAYKIDEDEDLKLKLRLDKTPGEEYNLQVFSVDNTAISDVNYIGGPHNVTFRKGSRISNEFSVGIKKDPTYTGDKNFSLIIDDDQLPLGLVAGAINTAIITIVDNEYTLCFNQPTVSVVEKERVELVLTVSKKLSRSVRVNLIYSNGTGYPATYFPRPPGDYYGPSFVYVSTRTNVDVTITTRTDNTLEYNETFAVSIPSDFIHNSSAAADCITTVDVLIINDDCVTVEFERTTYPPLSNKNDLLKPVLELSNPIAYPIQVTLQGENGTAKSGEDYTIQNKEPIIIYPEDKQKRAIFIDTVDDDVVETLIEEFYIDISYVANENGGVNDYLKIGKDNRTTLQIKDDDECKVMIIEERLTFSKSIYRNASIEIEHIKGPPFLDWLLAGETEYVFDDAIAESDIVKIKVCIPKDLFDERPRRRVTSSNRKVEICSLVD